MGGVFEPSVVIPFVVSVGALVGFYVWYRHKIRDLELDTDERPIPGARLTAESLRNLSSPPWRVVFEIGEKHLGPVDHVVIGPVGVLAIETLTTDRPVDTHPAAEAHLVANAAIARGGVDDLATRVGAGCKTLVRVYWGTPRPESPAGAEVAPGLVAVEGQRLQEWLVGLPPGPLLATQVDRAWQAVAMGIGRPDPTS